MSNNRSILGYSESLDIQCFQISNAFCTNGVTLNQYIYDSFRHSETRPWVKRFASFRGTIRVYQWSGIVSRYPKSSDNFQTAHRWSCIVLVICEHKLENKRIEVLRGTHHKATEPYFSVVGSAEFSKRLWKKTYVCGFLIHWRILNCQNIL